MADPQGFQLGGRAVGVVQAGQTHRGHALRREIITAAVARPA
jgi:hypothetical protein